LGGILGSLSPDAREAIEKKIKKLMEKGTFAEIRKAFREGYKIVEIATIKIHSTMLSLRVPTSS
jgi:biotin operon repressor